MTWSHELYSISSRVRRWTSKLEAAFSSNSWNQPRVASGYIGSLVIELDNLIVDSLHGHALSLVRRHQSQGNTIRRIGLRSISRNQFNALMLEALQPQAYNRKGSPLVVDRRECPNIRDPNQLLQCLSGMGIQNLLDLQNATALNFSVFSDIKFSRHYYAHRNFETFDSLRRNAAPLTAGVVSTPEDYLCFRDPTSRITKFIEWTSEVRLFFDVATP